MAKKKKGEVEPVSDNAVVEKGKAGRPKVEIDENLVRELAKIHCTRKEIAAVVGCHVDTLYDRFSEVLREGDECGKMSLKKKMHEVAFAGNVQMLIWLSKQRLDYRDTPQTEATQINFNVNVTEVPK